MITGQDLVEWQLRVAAGEKLWMQQDDLRITGHAIEARIYAEDPARDFLPSIGRLAHLRQPAEDRHVRVDTGVRAGDRISVDYDPMIAKLIVWDSDRDRAVRRLTVALGEYEVAGVQTNLALLGADRDLYHRRFRLARGVCGACRCGVDRCLCAGEMSGVAILGSHPGPQATHRPRAVPGAGLVGAGRGVGQQGKAPAAAATVFA